MLGRLFALLILTILLTSVAWANSGTARVTAFPSISLADGRSTLTITVEVRTESGTTVADGTQVVLETTLGTFRENIVRTQNGFARGILVAPSNGGVAKVRANALSIGAFGETTVEFVTDRSLLDAARDYIEVFGGDSLIYSVQDRVIEATGSGQRAELRYRDIVISADDMQVKVTTYEVIAKRAKVTIGKNPPQEFDQIFLKLNTRRGFGTTRIQLDRSVLTNGIIQVAIPSQETRFAAVDIQGTSLVERTEPIDERLLTFSPIENAVSMVYAKRATAFPMKEVQFQRADVRVAGQSVMKLPLFSVNVNTASPVITEQFLNVSSNQLALNYPFYLGLKPGETSLLRFRWGSLYGTGIGAAAGMFLDYEYKWNQGDRMDGGVTISGLLRDDWGANIRQFWMLPDRTTISAQVDAPAHRSLFASTNIGKPFNGFSVNLNANYGRTLRGPAFENNSTSFVFEKDPIKTGKLPANLFLGFTSTNQSLKAGSSRESQSTLGFQARLVSNPIRFGPGMNGNASYRLAQLSGTNVQKGLTQQFNFSLGAAITEGLAMNLSYDFIDDGFSSSLLGQHRLTTEAYFSLGRTSFTAYFSRSLDVDRLESRGTFRYNMGSLWRFNYSGTFSKYLTDSYSDQSFIISYKLGFREIGLSYSQRTRRLGIELLGTSFN